MITRQRRTLLIAAAAMVAAVLCCGCADNGVGGAFGKQRYPVNKCGKDGTDASCKTVTIGGVEWMAENLNRKPSSGNSWCYDDKEYNCDRFGRLYDWEAAQGICPAGWYLPTKEEWDSLTSAAGGYYGAGKTLMSRSGWRDWNGRSGSDEYGFTALPGGGRLSGGFHTAGSGGNWWTADTAYDGRTYDGTGGISGNDCDSYNPNGCAYSWKMESEDDRMYLYYKDRKNGYSVRCVTGAGNNIVRSPNNCGRDKTADLCKTVYIGETNWLAENLNLDTADSWCYGNMVDSCTKYGRLYTWAAAKAACWAIGWNLPDTADWARLAAAAGGKEAAAKKLKAKWGWNPINGQSGSGSDVFGFSALPGGYRSRRDFPTGGNAGETGAWWSATTAAAIGGDYAYTPDMIYFSDRVSTNVYGVKTDGYSVRCIQDNPTWNEWKVTTPATCSAPGVETRSSTQDTSRKETRPVPMLTGTYCDPVIVANTCGKDGTDSSCKKVTIRGRTWLAENLNYTPVVLAKSRCYGNNAGSCDKYGRLYTWQGAAEACEKIGWNLPDTTDWNLLINATGNQSTAAIALKATSGWNPNGSASGNGTDSLGFSALPGGASYGDVDYRLAGDIGNWWTATSGSESDNAYFWWISNDFARVYRSLGGKNGGSYFSARCVLGDGSHTHTWNAWTTTIPATCDAPGVKTRTCTLGDSTETEEIQRLSGADCESTVHTHSWGDWIVTTKPTCTATGVETITCTQDASHKETREIPRLSGESCNTCGVDGTGGSCKTVEIDGVTWMAENLNYAPSSGSWCYGDKPDSCAKYGRLYTWEAATAVCPTGWKLPDTADWNRLVEAAGGRWDGAAGKLKSMSGWVNYNGESGNGTDSLGFSALPGGYRNSTGPFFNSGLRGEWWTATVISDNYAYHWNILYSGDVADGVSEKGSGYSVRCVVEE